MTVRSHSQPGSDEGASEGPPEVEDEDSYFDGPYLVFTEAYHRKRGYCCQSGCRHCPYGFGKPEDGPAAAAKS